VTRSALAGTIIDLIWNHPTDITNAVRTTNAVVKELLRHRPPVIFVPYAATKAFPVTLDYTVPKGAMIVPSCYPALRDPVVFPNLTHFDPDRWITGDAETKAKNWLVFDAGAHDCLARKYVPLIIAHMIGKASLELDWVHHATQRSEEIRVFATLFPMVRTSAERRPRTDMLTCALGRVPADLH